MTTTSNETHPTPETGSEEPGEPLFPIQGYIWLNLFFWAFCAFEVLLVRWWFKDVRGVIFFFGLLAIGFTVVSIYDCLYDRLHAHREKPDQP